MCQAIIWTNDGLLLNEPLGRNFSEIRMKTWQFSFKKMNLKMSSAKWWPFCLNSRYHTSSHQSSQRQGKYLEKLRATILSHRCRSHQICFEISLAILNNADLLKIINSLRIFEKICLTLLSSLCLQMALYHLVPGHLQLRDDLDWVPYKNGTDTWNVSHMYSNMEYRKIDKNKAILNCSLVQWQSFLWKVDKNEKSF